MTMTKNNDNDYEHNGATSSSSSSSTTSSATKTKNSKNNNYIWYASFTCKGNTKRSFVIMVGHVPYFIEQAKIKIGWQKSLPCVDHVSIGLDGEWFVRLEEGDWRCKWSI